MGNDSKKNGKNTRYASRAVYIQARSSHRKCSTLTHMEKIEVFPMAMCGTSILAWVTYEGCAILTVAERATYLEINAMHCSPTLKMDSVILSICIIKLCI